MIKLLRIFCASSEKEKMKKKKCWQMTEKKEWTHFCAFAAEWHRSSCYIAFCCLYPYRASIFAYQSNSVDDFRKLLHRFMLSGLFFLFSFVGIAAITFYIVVIYFVSPLQTRVDKWKCNGKSKKKEMCHCFKIKSTLNSLNFFVLRFLKKVLLSLS